MPKACITDRMYLGIPPLQGRRDSRQDQRVNSTISSVMVHASMFLGFWIILKVRAIQTMEYEMEVAQSAVNIMHSSYPTQCFRIVLWSCCVTGSVGCCWYDVGHGSIETRDCLLCSGRMFVCGWQGVKARRRIGMLHL